MKRKATKVKDADGADDQDAAAKPSPGDKSSFGKKDEKKEASPADDGGDKKDATGDHDDEAQDVALIKKMIGEYLGKDEEDSEEVQQMCKEAYEAYTEMGYEADEAMKATGHAMKLAKHMASKETTKESEEGEEGEEKKESKEKGAEQLAAEKKASVESEEADESKESHTKESATIIKLQAENAALKESAKKIETEKHIEKILRESGLPRSVTGIFKASLMESKSVKDIDAKFKLFVETYRAAKGSETDELPFIVSSEKQGEKTTPISFDDCVN